MLKRHMMRERLIIRIRYNIIINNNIHRVRYQFTNVLNRDGCTADTDVQQHLHG